MKIFNALKLSERPGHAAWPVGEQTCFQRLVEGRTHSLNVPPAHGLD